MLKKEQDKEKRLRKELGVNNRTGVAKLAHRPYFTARMNARNLKTRIRARVREHKDELNPIQRTLERSSSSKYLFTCPDLLADDERQERTETSIYAQPSKSVNPPFKNLLTRTTPNATPSKVSSHKGRHPARRWHQSACSTRGSFNSTSTTPFGTIKGWTMSPPLRRPGGYVTRTCAKGFAPCYRKIVAWRRVLDF